MSARELYEANATDYPHIRWEALAPREKEGWEHAAGLAAPEAHANNGLRAAVEAAADGFDRRVGHVANGKNPYRDLLDAAPAPTKDHSTDTENLAHEVTTWLIRGGWVDEDEHGPSAEALRDNLEIHLQSLLGARP